MEMHDFVNSNLSHMSEVMKLNFLSGKTSIEPTNLLIHFYLVWSGPSGIHQTSLYALKVMQSGELTFSQE